MEKKCLTLRLAVASAFVGLSFFILLHLTFQYTRSICLRILIVAGSSVIAVLAVLAINYLVKRQFSQGLDYYIFDRFLGVELHESKAFGKQEGFGMFSALAGFALAQGAALTAVAKGEGKDRLVLGIYLFAVVFTVAWNRTMLVAKETSDKPLFVPTPISKPVFSKSSITFGTWTMAWNVVLGATMFALGCFELLPNQKTRQVYKSTAIIDCVVEKLDTYAARRMTDEWLIYLDSKFPTTQGIFWIEAKSRFDANYESFEAELTLPNPFQIDQAVAFLLNQETVAKLPIYKQVGARKRENSTEWILSLHEPNENDQVVVIAFASDISKGKSKPDGASIKPLP